MIHLKLYFQIKKNKFISLSRKATFGTILKQSNEENSLPFQTGTHINTEKIQQDDGPEEEKTERRQNLPSHFAKSKGLTVKKQ